VRGTIDGSTERRATVRIERLAYLVVLPAVLAVAVLTVGCGGGDSDDEADSGASEAMTATPVATESAMEEPNAVDVEMRDIEYSVNEIDTTAGEPITIHFVNAGTVQHDFNIDDIEVADVSAEGTGMNKSGEEAPIHVHLMPGDEETLTFTPEETGEFAYFCTQEGHRQAGMEGTLVVTGSPG
jgi:uncharacterized cupredoxin-like copper-binding protein